MPNSNSEVPAKPRTSRSIQMICHKKGDQVVVEAKDGDRFVVQTKKAIAALKAIGGARSFEAQLGLLLNRLAGWAIDQAGISNVFLTLGDGGFLFLAIKDDVEYDEVLEESLSDLDLDLANSPDLDMIRLDVMALPKVGEVALDSFLNNDFNLHFRCSDAESQ